MAEQEIRTALIVEPSLVEGRQLRRLALRAGIERVLLADDGPEAVTMIGEELVDLVITPWEAGDLGGVDLLRALRKLARNRRVPVVLLDNGIHRQVIITAVKAGVAGRLQMPAQPEQLREILAVISEGKKQQPQPPPQRIHPKQGG